MPKITVEKVRERTPVVSGMIQVGHTERTVWRVREVGYGTIGAYRTLKSALENYPDAVKIG